MTRRTAAFAFTIIAITGLGFPAEATAPCQDLVRLRSAASEAWQQAMRSPPSARCGVFYHAASATQVTLAYANNNQQACDISDALLSQLEGYHREAVKARDNVCAGRPIRPYPADIIRR